MGLGCTRCVISWFVTADSQGDHGMNRCLRSLPCFLTFAVLAVFSTDASARDHKQHARKTHEAREARPHRSAALGKRRHEKHADAERKSKRSKDESPPKEAKAPLTGDLALAHRDGDHRQIAQVDAIVGAAALPGGLGANRLHQLG